MNYRYILLALITVIVAGCSEEDTLSGNGMQEVRVAAGTGTNSRIVMNNQGNYTRSLWRSGDKISLFTATQSNLVYTTTLPQDSAYAKFTPAAEKLQYIEGNKVYATYPETTSVGNGVVVSIPSTNTLDYNNGSIRSFGYAVGNISKGSVDFTFRHISAFLCLTLTPEMLASATSNVVGSISVSTTSSVPLSVGKGDTFDFSTLTANTTSGSNTVEVTSINHTLTENWTVYIPVLPQPADATLTVTVAGNDGSTLYTLSKAAPATGFLAGNVYRLTLKPEVETSTDVAYLIDGPTFNERIKQLANGNYTITVSDKDSIINKIEFKTEVETISGDYVQVSSNNSKAPIYASYNKENGLLTVFTSAKRMEIVNAQFLFNCLISLRTIDFGRFKITENTTDMRLMFQWCTSLQTIDCSTWNTSNVTDMFGLFNACISLESLDIATWNTSNVTNMGAMFSNCYGLTFLDIAKWDVTNVTTMDEMFWQCYRLSSLDISNWNTSNVTNMFRLFGQCYQLASIDVSNWNVSKVTSISSMFYNCYILTSLDVSNWDTSNIEYATSAFYGCSSLTSLNISNWNTSNVTDMKLMFCGCESLTSLDVSKWDTSNVTDMQFMFDACYSLSFLDVSNWKTSNVTNICAMFQRCSSLISLDVSKWDTSNVKDMSNLFYSCSSLTSLDFSKWDISNVYDMGLMLYECSSLASLDISNWSWNNNIGLTNMFLACASTSQPCEITATQATQDFLLSITETTGMEPSYFTWKRAESR